MPRLTILLLAVIGVLQYSLWFGKGGWMRVWDVDRQVQTQRATNHALKVRNASLEAEVVDLKNGLQAVEERARSDLGLTRNDEIFVQILGDRHPR
jgi:cell division protein FtsB